MKRTMGERGIEIFACKKKSVHGQYILRVTDWGVLGLSRHCGFTKLMRKKKSTYKELKLKGCACMPTKAKRPIFLT